jgi:hypothetical protein
MPCWNVKAFETFVQRAIPEEDILLGAKFKFPRIVWP